MISVSLEEAILLLNKWKEGDLWVGAWVRRGEGLREEHKFWARVSEATPEALVLAGEAALVEVKVAPATTFGYAETSEVPARLRELFEGYEFLFTIRSHNVVAFLFGHGPKND